MATGVVGLGESVRGCVGAQIATEDALGQRLFLQFLGGEGGGTEWVAADCRTDLWDCFPLLHHEIAV